MTQTIPPRLQASFDRQSMMKTLGATLVPAEGAVVIRAPMAPHLLQQQGAAHAALAFAIGDSAAGYAALATMPEDRDVMTVEMKINLLAPAVGEYFEAVGKVVRAGKRLTVVTAEVFAISGARRKTIALLQGTMIPVDPA